MISFNWFFFSFASNNFDSFFIVANACLDACTLLVSNILLERLKAFVEAIPMASWFQEEGCNCELDVAKFIHVIFMFILNVPNLILLNFIIYYLRRKMIETFNHQKMDLITDWIYFIEFISVLI